MIYRAVYYCRVSTDDENQAASLANQIKESIQAIENNQWRKIDGYIEMKIA